MTHQATLNATEWTKQAYTVPESGTLRASVHAGLRVSAHFIDAGHIGNFEAGRPFLSIASSELDQRAQILEAKGLVPGDTVYLVVKSRSGAPVEVKYGLLG